MNKPIRVISRAARQKLRLHHWPGNVRELRNVIERASILEDGEFVTSSHLPADMLDGLPVNVRSDSTIHLPIDGVSLETVELELAKQAVERTNGNLTRAAKLLNISRDQLRYKLKKLGHDLNAIDVGDE
jgi:DNA-binding NtrC family response regulator